LRLSCKKWRPLTHLQANWSRTLTGV